MRAESREIDAGMRLGAAAVPEGYAMPDEYAASLAALESASVLYVTGRGAVARCGCVLSESREYEPCREHDVMLAVMTAGPEYSDLGVRHKTAEPWAGLNTGSASKPRTYKLDADVVAGLANMPVDILPLIERSGIIATPRFPRLTELLLRPIIEDARGVWQAERDAAILAGGNSPTRPTTRRGRKAAVGAPKRQRTMAETAKVRDITSGHNSPQDVGESLAERAALIAAALAVGGDTWADRRG